MANNPQLAGDTFLKLANCRMPFGKYANKLLIDIPEEYFLWFSKKGFPRGELGQYMLMMLEIKTNGLEYLFDPFNKTKKVNPTNFRKTIKIEKK